MAAVLLKLEKRISEVPIESKELGYTKPGPYIYELLADLNITHDSVPKLIKTLEDATVLIEKENQNKATRSICRLESITDMLNIIFRDADNNHAKSYRVSLVVVWLVVKLLSSASRAGASRAGASLKVYQFLDYLFFMIYSALTLGLEFGFVKFS